jgi:hypothetical protein
MADSRASEMFGKGSWGENKKHTNCTLAQNFKI